MSGTEHERDGARRDDGLFSDDYSSGYGDSFSAAYDAGYSSDRPTDYTPEPLDLDWSAPSGGGELDWSAPSLDELTTSPGDGSGTYASGDYSALPTERTPTSARAAGAAAGAAGAAAAAAGERIEQARVPDGIRSRLPDSVAQRADDRLAAGSAQVQQQMAQRREQLEKVTESVPGAAQRRAQSAKQSATQKAQKTAGGCLGKGLVPLGILLVVLYNVGLDPLRNLVESIGDWTSGSGRQSELPRDEAELVPVSDGTGPQPSTPADLGYETPDAASIAWAEETFGAFEPLSAAGSVDEDSDIELPLPEDIGCAIVTVRLSTDDYAFMDVRTGDDDYVDSFSSMRDGGEGRNVFCEAEDRPADHLLLQSVSGPWEVVVEPVAAAPALPMELTGANGDNGPFLYGGGAATLSGTVPSSDEGGFYVNGYTVESLPYPAEILFELDAAETSGELPAGPLVVDNRSHGDYTLTVE